MTIAPPPRFARPARRLLVLLVALLGVALAQTSYPVTIRHDLGETLVPARPARVVVIAEEVAEIAHVLGVRPVGYASRRPAGAALGAPIGDLPSPLARTLRGATWVGLTSAPSLDTLLALKPDLILAFTNEGAFMQGDGYARLSRIAPTLAFDFDAERDVTWGRALLETGRALDREDRARRFLSQHAATMTLLRKRFAPLVARSKRLALLFMPNAAVTAALGPKHPFALVMTRLGFTLTLPGGLTVPNGTSAAVGAEGLGLLRADVVLALRLQSPDGAVARLPNEDVLGRLPSRYLRYPLPPLEPSSGPVTDLTRARAVLALLEAR